MHNEEVIDIDHDDARITPKEAVVGVRPFRS